MNFSLCLPANSLSQSTRSIFLNGIQIMGLFLGLEIEGGGGEDDVETAIGF